MNCLLCGEEMLDVKDKDGNYIGYKCTNTPDEHEDPYGYCENFDQVFEYDEMCEELEKEIERMNKEWNKVHKELEKYKWEEKQREQKKFDRSFKGIVAKIKSFYWRERQKWIYKTCKHNIETYVYNGGESWTTECTKCGMLIDED